MDRVARLVVLVSLAILPLRPVAAQDPRSVPAGSIGHIASRFLPIDVITRMAERPEGLVDSVSFGSPVDSVWSALKSTIGRFDLPVGFEERSSWQIGNAGAKVYRRLGKSPVSTYLRCGDGPTGPNADNYVVYLSFLSVLKPGEGSGVALYTLITGQAVDLAGGRNDPVNCITTGRLEREIGKQVAKALGPKA